MHIETVDLRWTVISPGVKHWMRTDCTLLWMYSRILNQSLWHDKEWKYRDPYTTYGQSLYSHSWPSAKSEVPSLPLTVETRACSLRLQCCLLLASVARPLMRLSNWIIELIIIQHPYVLQFLFFGAIQNLHCAARRYNCVAKCDAIPLTGNTVLKHN